MNVLVLNAGASSVKFQLISTDTARIGADTDERLARGIVERIGGEALVSFVAKDGRSYRTAMPIRTHRAAIEAILRWIAGEESDTGVGALRDIDAVGHRVVHGGERFTQSVVVTPEVAHELEETIELAPLHNPHNLKGIAAARELLGAAVPQVAVFDTSFHHTMPEHAFLYAIPYALYRRHRLRRYGFHGTSHRYVAYRYRKLTGTERDATRLITLHLGNGCSACAIAGGDSQDTSMGFTPLEGLVMGTRSGDLDPAILEYLEGKEGLTSHEVLQLLNKQSGLRGISGLTDDMRELLDEEREHGDRRARLAIDVFCYRARKYIGAYLAAIGGADAIVFTGGIGENSADIRARILDGLDWFGLELDAAANAAAVGGAERPITTDASRLAVWVIPTDEELLIARDTVRLVQGSAVRS
jgi:acetate kinase